MEITTDQPPTVRDYHPAAALFPLMPVDSLEFGELVRDLREHGLLQPIVLHGGRILDDRNRYRLYQPTGVSRSSRSGPAGA